MQTHRSPENWAASFDGTIYKLLAGRDQAPPEMKEWLAMAAAVVAKTGFPYGLDRAVLFKAFVAHCDAVKATIPAAGSLAWARCVEADDD